MKTIELMIEKMACGWTCVALGCKTRPSLSGDHFCDDHWRLVPFDVAQQMLLEKKKSLRKRRWSARYLRLAHEAVFHAWKADEAEKRAAEKRVIL